MANILIFGDSISYGFFDSEGGWVDRLKRHCQSTEEPEQEEHTKIYNLGISGDTSSDILKRFECELIPRNWEGQETIIMLAVGLNDAILIKNKPKISGSDLEKNLSKFISISGRYSDNLIIVGPTPIDEKRVTPMSWSTTEFWYKDRIQKYNAIINNVCREKDIKFINLYEKLIDTDYVEQLADGGHPNKTGHKMIFQFVKKFLSENKII
jgi:acyl-CoA thioesterase-1